MKCIRHFAFLGFLSVSICLAIQEPYKIFVTTIPKTGTTMLSKLVCILTNLEPQGSASTLTAEDVNLPENGFLLSHAPAFPENVRLIRDKGFKTLILLRDPRDVIVSMYYYFAKEDARTLGLDYQKDKDIMMLRYITKWYFAVSHDSLDGYYLMNDYEKFLAWGQLQDVYFTRYEKLVGSKGGGSDEEQKQEIDRIAYFLGIGLNDEELTGVAKNLHGGTSTFRNGVIGSWKQHFKKEHIEAFKKYTGNLLITLGYEKDDQWGL